MGQVDSVTIREGVPYLNIGDQNMSYAEYREAGNTNS